MQYIASLCVRQCDNPSHTWLQVGLALLDTSGNILETKEVHLGRDANTKHWVRVAPKCCFYCNDSASADTAEEGCAKLVECLNRYKGYRFHFVSGPSWHEYALFHSVYRQYAGQGVYAIPEMADSQNTLASIHVALGMCPLRLESIVDANLSEPSGSVEMTALWRGLQYVQLCKDLLLTTHA